MCLLLNFLFGSDLLSSIPEEAKPHMLNANVFPQFKLSHALMCASMAAESRCDYKMCSPMVSLYAAAAKVYERGCLMCCSNIELALSLSLSPVSHAGSDASGVCLSLITPGTESIFALKGSTYSTRTQTCPRSKIYRHTWTHSPTSALLPEGLATVL